MGYEVDVSEGSPDEERRAGRGRRARGKGTKGERKRDRGRGNTHLGTR